MSAESERMAAAFREQSHWCSTLGSPFSSAFLLQAAEDIDTGSDIMAFLRDLTARPVPDVAALRVLGCAHALALSGRAPALAAHYPSCGGDGDANGIWNMALAAMKNESTFTERFVQSAPQTNEVARAAGLMAGLLEVAALWRGPIDVYEIGASGGLLQNLDRFFYEFGDARWGDPASPCRLTPKWHLDAWPPCNAPLEIAARHACDLNPLDVTDPENVIRLRSYVWTDQAERLARLDGALAIAQAHPPHVTAGSADSWLAGVLPQTPRDRGSVLFHSVMWQYMPAAVQANATQAILDAGARATPEAPFAWLRFEPLKPNTPMSVSLAVWDGSNPAGETRQIGLAHPHGIEIGWLGWDKGEAFASPRLDQVFNEAS